MVQISPSLFSIPAEGLAAAVTTAFESDYFHIDVTDGVFVKDKEGGASLFWDETKLNVIVDNSEVPLDIHLMVKNPLQHIERYAQFNPEYISFHLEATDNPRDVIDKIREYGVKPAIALNPNTPISEIVDLVDDIDMVLLMSVVPGKGGQGYIPTVTDKVAALRKMVGEKNVVIEVDGGIKLENAYLPINAGADIIVSGTGVFGVEDYTPNEVIKRLRDAVCLASDHGGYELKERLKSHLASQRVAYRDLGCHNTNSVDYPDLADQLAGSILRGDYSKGVLICGTGIGMSIRANRYPGIRAALCRDVFSAEMSRAHNNSNVLVLGERSPTIDPPEEIFDTWYETGFAGEQQEGGERHTRRVRKLGMPLRE